MRLMNKICTSIGQSNKLIELGIDVSTADMYWVSALDGMVSITEPYMLKTEDGTLIPAYKGAIPAWSLTALQDIITIESNLHGFYSNCEKVYRMETLYAGNSRTYDNPIDACINMIEKLHERKLL